MNFTSQRGLVIGWTVISFSLIACSKKSSDGNELKSAGPRSFVSNPVQALSDISGLEQSPAVIRNDLKDIFCVHVYKLPLKSDFSQELAVLCENNKPSKTFLDLDRYAGLVGSIPRSVKFRLEHRGDFSEGVFATVYRVPIAPKWVRSATIQEYMVSSSSYDYVSLQGKVDADHSEELGGDLQFGKWNLSYQTEVDTPAGTHFSNQRSTELNSFQVHGGNPDIGIGAEHLTDPSNPNYHTYNTTTVTIANEDGGSTLITIIRVDVQNNGFPDLAEKVMSDIASAQATQVHDGLMAEREAGHFP